MRRMIIPWTWNSVRRIEKSMRRQCFRAAHQFRTFNLTSSIWQKTMPDRPKPPSEDEFTEVFVKGSGPGGQKINKTSSAVQLKHIPTGIVVKSQETRSQKQNRKIARQKLAERIENLEKGDQSREAVLQRTKSKKKSSAMKKSRRKYRALEEAKMKESGKGEVSEGEDGGCVEEPDSHA